MAIPTLSGGKSSPPSIGPHGAVIRHLDLVTVGAVIALAVMGLLSVFSATVDPYGGGLLNPRGGISSTLFNRQLVFCVVAAVVLFGVMLFDYRHFKVYAPVLYVICLFLLLVVLTPLGESVKGSQRWISLGLLKLQPSELTKPILVAVLAAYLSERRFPLELRDVVRCAALTAPLALFVFLQPDFGTMLVLGWILIVMLVIGGAPWRHLLVLLGGAVTGAFALFQLGMVRNYQRMRLFAFLDPEGEEYRFSEGYNYILTSRAVGNGGLFGRGLMSKDPTSLTNLDYVREQHTDFVFTVLAEGTGFVGSVLVVILFATIFVRGLRGASMAREPFGSLLASGLVGYLAFQVFVNIGMTVRLVPITGVPLPFVSYGGSSLVASSLAVGILLSIRMRRFSRPLV